MDIRIHMEVILMDTRMEVTIMVILMTRRRGTTMTTTTIIATGTRTIMTGTHGHDHGHGHDHAHGDSHGHDHPVRVNEVTPLLAPKTATPNKPKKKQPTNINVQSAAIHVIGDLISSIGVLISSIIILIWPEMTIVDPICTFIFSVFVILTTVTLMNNSLGVLMEATPSDMDPTAIERSLLTEIPNVIDVHDLHIWTLTQGKAILTAHIVFVLPTAASCAASSKGGSLPPSPTCRDASTSPTRDGRLAPDDEITSQTLTHSAQHHLRCGDLHRMVLKRAQEIVKRYGVHHATFQVEPARQAVGSEEESSGDEEVEIRGRATERGVKGSRGESGGCGVPEMCRGSHLKFASSESGCPYLS
ncbi:hypothetical protein HDU67_002295 [Dinochytrium kinnereticum]|nr:hypothetical protein HDU67_002295 [Dinochytrium kinnereticum]